MARYKSSADASDRAQDLSSPAARREAQREELRQQRARLVSARDTTLARLREIEDALAEVDARERLLHQLAAPNQSAVLPSGSGAHRTAAAPGDSGDAAAEALSTRILRGPAIRETAVRLLVRHGRIEALHYRQWFELLTREGYTVAGKNGLAVFLTQISRSPAVRKGTQAGVYELDREGPRRLWRELERLQGEMRELSDRTRDTADLSVVRTRRVQLTNTIGRTERALEEAQRVLRNAENDDDTAKPLAVAI